MYKSNNFQILIPTPGQVRKYGKDEILIEDGPAMLRTIRDADISMRIESVWARKAKIAIEKGGELLAEPKYRLVSCSESKRGMTLELGATDYRELIGTNVEAGKDPEYMNDLIERGKNRGDEDSFFSNALGICSVVKTSDGKIVAGLRSQSVGEYKSCWHTIAGHPDPINYPTGTPDMLDSMAKEMR